MQEHPNTTTSAESPKVDDPTTAASNGKSPTSTKVEGKDYTTDLPMFDLEEIMIQFVSEIHSNGLERAKMPEVAKHFKYEAPSSTPFYRKLVAARLFGLLSPNGAELLDRARDYVSPTTDDSKNKALLESIMGVPYYAEFLNGHAGKKMNVELVGNDIARKFVVSKGCGKRCAKVFESSLRFAGLLSPENVVTATPQRKKESEEEEDGNETDQTQKHTLYLDKQKRRKFQITAPLTISKAELDRITSWLSFTIIVDDETE